MFVYELPLNEVVFDFYDRLKAFSRGYATIDYQSSATGGRSREADMLVNGEPVEPYR